MRRFLRPMCVVQASSATRDSPQGNSGCTVQCGVVAWELRGVRELVPQASLLLRAS
jgi:hypothetical protein